jgi:hypothetical protein
MPPTPFCFEPIYIDPIYTHWGGNVTPDAATTCHHRLRNFPATEYALVYGLQGRMQTSGGAP